MPRGFSEADREAIRAALLDAGEADFRRYGLRKTSVEQLARAAGIAKGTFYGFFASKEELCMAIFERQEDVLSDALASLLAGDAGPVETVVVIMGHALDYVTHDSLLARLREDGDLALIARGVGSGRWRSHLERDEAFVGTLFTELRRRGARAAVAPEVAAGVLRAVTTLGFHDSEIGADVFPAVLSHVLRWVAEGLVNGKVAA